MMIAEATRSTPTVQIPPWDPIEDLTFPIHFNGNATNTDYLTSLHHYLPSNEMVCNNNEFDSLSSEDSDLPPIDAFSCDYFRMYEFKVRRCARGRSHDWTECPYAHPGEKARRRDPRKYHYSGTACPDFRKGNCLKGDTCEFAHGVFECWLHPARYRTQPCKDGPGCRRRVCFFAHTPDQLRVLPTQQSPRGTGSGLLLSDADFGSSPVRHRLEAYLGKNCNGSFVSSPTSILTSPPISPRSNSPPMSPSGCQLGGGPINSVSELVASMRGLQFGKLKMGSWGQIGSSPRGSTLRPGFCSLPSTPTRTTATTTRSGSGLSQLDIWESTVEEEPAMERVESGKGLRAKIYAKLSKENSLDRVDSAGSGPDFGWVSELVK